MDRHEAYIKHEEEAATTIIPYKMRRLFKMRDPYSVLVARNWARDMAGLEGLLCLGVLFFFACVTFFGGTTSGDDPLVADDDDFTVAGVALTGHVALRGSSADGGSGDDGSRSLAWADFAVAPFAAKGLLLLLEVSAVGCACAGACLASCCHFKCGSLREVDLLAALGWCSGCSALATAASLAFTAVCLLYKWERALGASEIRGALLVLSMYGVMAAILFCLRLSTTYKAFLAATALKEEVIAV